MKIYKRGGGAPRRSWIRLWTGSGKFHVVLHYIALKVAFYVYSFLLPPPPKYLSISDVELSFVPHMGIN